MFWASPKRKRTTSSWSWLPSCTWARWSSSKGVAKSRLSKKAKTYVSLVVPISSRWEFSLDVSTACSASSLNNAFNSIRIAISVYLRLELHPHYVTSNAFTKMYRRPRAIITDYGFRIYQQCSKKKKKWERAYILGNNSYYRYRQKHPY